MDSKIKTLTFLADSLWLSSKLCCLHVLLFSSQPGVKTECLSV